MTDHALLDVSGWPAVSFVPAGEYNGDALIPAPVPNLCAGVSLVGLYRVSLDDLLAAKVAQIPKTITCPAGVFAWHRTSTYGFCAYYVRVSEEGRG